MKKRRVLNLAALFTLTFAIGIPTISFAAQAGNDQLRVKTGTPKKTKETIFSSLVSWKQEEGAENKAKGLTYIDGSNTKTAKDVEAAKKIAKSLNGGINYEAPGSRGATVKYTDNTSEFVVTNTSGFDLTRVIFGDYTNQKLQYNIPGKSFSEASVDLAIDLVYSAAVEYIDNFSSNIVQETAGGVISVTIDNKSPIEIKTKGKSTKQLETEISKALGGIAHFSSEPIYPNIVELKSRNYKPFDGGEIQIFGLNAKSITIDVNDSGLGVLTKFRFPAVNEPEDNFENSVMKLVGFLLVASLGAIFYARKKSKTTPS
ncbi:MAG: hypothetical protein KAH20_02880 [Methylococcales bacterium]|nr:hypothetical protein [Methylococcales bacterium]